MGNAAVATADRKTKISLSAHLLFPPPNFFASHSCATKRYATEIAVTWQ